MSDTLPTVVFLQFGGSDYFYYTLKLAKKNVPQDVVVITDSNNFSGVNLINYRGLTTSRISQLINAYEHVSVNAYQMELVCFLRWFFILEFMKKENIKHIFYMDSDVALCSPFASICNSFQQYQLVVSGISGHTSFFTLEALEEFCDYIHYFMIKGSEAQKREAKIKIASGWQGGVCDMTAIKDFYDIYEGEKFDSTKAKNEGRLNHNINVTGDYREQGVYELDAERGIMQLYYNNGKVYGKKKDETYVEFATLHFQGRAKKFIKPFYRMLYGLGHKNIPHDSYVSLWEDNI